MPTTHQTTHLVPDVKKKSNQISHVHRLEVDLTRKHILLSQLDTHLILQHIQSIIKVLKYTLCRKQSDTGGIHTSSTWIKVYIIKGMWGRVE